MFMKWGVLKIEKKIPGEQILTQKGAKKKVLLKRVAMGPVFRREGIPQGNRRGVQGNRAPFGWSREFLEYAPACWNAGTLTPCHDGHYSLNGRNTQCRCFYKPFIGPIAPRGVPYCPANGFPTAMPRAMRPTKE